MPEFLTTSEEEEKDVISPQETYVLVRKARHTRTTTSNMRTATAEACRGTVRT